MSTEFHNKPKSTIARSHHISSLASLLLLTLMIGSVFFAITHPTSAKNAAAPASFTFTSTGDYGQSTNTTANLQYIGKSVANGGPGASFNLGLGDFNYSYPSVTAAQWSTYAKGNLPANFPFEMVGGDHDKGDLSSLIADMPNQISNVSGTYGQEYYFDYPASTPLARFIMISPGLSGNYNVGGTDYNWVLNTVNAAHSAHIPWVIVGMAEGCLFINGVSDSQPCQSGDLLNLLVSHHVDLILQAHVHNYEASNQLALNSNCTSIPTDGTFNSNCVVPNATNTMTQGGTVIVNDGTGGKSLVNVINTDPKKGYFRTWMASNLSPTFGVSQITVSATQLSEQFVPLSKGTYKDSFTISNSTSTPTATVSPSITPSPSATVSPSITPSPSATAMPSLGADNFTRADQTYWGTASDTQKWGANANSFKVFSIKSNTGQVVATSNNNYYATLGPPAIDAQVQFSGSISNFTNANLGAVLRWTDSQDWYEALIDGTNLTIEKRVAGTTTKLKSVPFAATPATSYTLLFSITGSTLSASAWPTGGTQPGTWMATVTDTSLAATGNSGLHVVVQTGVTVSFTAFQANSLP